MGRDLRRRPLKKRSGGTITVPPGLPSQDAGAARRSCDGSRRRAPRPPWASLSLGVFTPVSGNGSGLRRFFTTTLPLPEAIYNKPSARNFRPLVYAGLRRRNRAQSLSKRLRLNRPSTVAPLSAPPAGLFRGFNLWTTQLVSVHNRLLLTALLLTLALGRRLTG